MEPEFRILSQMKVEFKNVSQNPVQVSESMYNYSFVYAKINQSICGLYHLTSQFKNNKKDAPLSECSTLFSSQWFTRLLALWCLVGCTWLVWAYSLEMATQGEIQSNDPKAACRCRAVSQHCDWHKFSVNIMCMYWKINGKIEMVCWLGFILFGPWIPVRYSIKKDVL